MQPVETESGCHPAVAGSVAGRPRWMTARRTAPGTNHVTTIKTNSSSLVTTAFGLARPGRRPSFTARSRTARMSWPLTLIGEAVFARCVSALKDERVAASKILKGPKPEPAKERANFIEGVRRALYCSKMISYAQGYMLLREAAREQKWNLNYGGIALMWRGGCIIRSHFLGKIKEAYDKNSNLSNLLLDDFFSKVLNEY